MKKFWEAGIDRLLARHFILWVRDGKTEASRAISITDEDLEELSPEDLLQRLLAEWTQTRTGTRNLEETVAGQEGAVAAQGAGE